MANVGRLVLALVIATLTACAARVGGDDPTKLVGSDVSVGVKAETKSGQVSVLGTIASVNDDDIVLNVTGMASEGVLRDNIARLETLGKVTTKPGPPLQVTIPRKEVTHVTRIDMSGWLPKPPAPSQ